jgi:hypothetical protein
VNFRNFDPPDEDASQSRVPGGLKEGFKNASDLFEFLLGCAQFFADTVTPSPLPKQYVETHE